MRRVLSRLSGGKLELCGGKAEVERSGTIKPRSSGMDLMKNPTDLQRKHWGRGNWHFARASPKAPL